VPIEPFCALWLISPRRLWESWLNLIRSVVLLIVSCFCCGGEPRERVIDSARHFRRRLEDFYRLQRRLLLATVLVSLVTVPIVAFTMNLSVAASVLVGACAGLLYVRLLARSVARLSDQSRGLGRFQLIVPTLLVVGSAKLPQLDLLPAFLGFLLYKPALILQHVFDDR
jgi:ATP synthase protein I